MGTLSSSDLLRFLRQEAPTKSTAVPAALQDGYLKAASVLTAIRDIDSLHPTLTQYAGPMIDAADVLGDRLVPASSRSFDGNVMLSSEARREGLSKLNGRQEILAALEANRTERKSELQIHFERYLLNEAEPLVHQTLPELEQTLQIALWADGLIEGLPRAEAVRQLIELKRLLGPFEALAGGDRFRGRKRELDILRSFVGVLPPESLLRRLGSKLQQWVLPAERTAMSVYGPGGVGKSALIAHFMLEHTHVREDMKIPFAYIDFDRPALDISDPLSLLVEALRQLALQFPGGRYENLHSFGQSQTRELDNTHGGDRFSAARALFADFLGTMQANLGPRPYLIVLDTFEEVQYRGETRASPLWQLLTEMLAIPARGGVGPRAGEQPVSGRDSTRTAGTGRA